MAAPRYSSGRTQQGSAPALDRPLTGVAVLRCGSLASTVCAESWSSAN